MKKKTGGASLGYLTKEGFKNVWVNRLMSIASISVLLSCLTMMGVAFMLVVNMEKIITGIEDANVIVAFVDDGADEATLEKVKNDLKSTRNIKNVQLVSKEDAYEEQLENLGASKSLLEGIENPLPDSYRITLEDLTLFDVTLEKIEEIDNIQSVREDRELSQQVSQIRKTVTYISIGVIAILLLVSLFIISNTIKITMFSRRLEIKIMKSVGATAWFIRWPFMVEGMLLGVISGLLSLGLVGGVYELVARSISGSFSMLLKGGIVPFKDYAVIILLAFLAVGIVTGMFGSAVSIKKYLKEQEYDGNEE